MGDIARELGASPRGCASWPTPALSLPAVVGSHRVFDPGAVRSGLARLATQELAVRRWSAPDWSAERPWLACRRTPFGERSRRTCCRIGSAPRPGSELAEYHTAAVPDAPAQHRASHRGVGEAGRVDG